MSEQFDPTRTTILRSRFVRAMNKRFNAVAGAIQRSIINDDCFGLIEISTQKKIPSAGRKVFNFPTDSQKIAGFMDWLQHKIEDEMLQVINISQVGDSVHNAWSNMYINDSYKRGVMRGNVEMRKIGYDIPTIQAQGGINAIMSQPVNMDRVGLLYIRVFNDLKGITNNMSLQISRVLAQGMADGDNPRFLARKMNKIIKGTGGDLSLTDTLGRFIPAKRRAEILARTEIIRAHHQGTMQTYKNWEAEGVSLKAEFVTAGDGRVCEECGGMEGNKYTLDEAASVIPVHPGCRCIMLPFKIKK